MKINLDTALHALPLFKWGQGACPEGFREDFFSQPPIKKR